MFAIICNDEHGAFGHKLIINVASNDNCDGDNINANSYGDISDIRNKKH